MKIQIVSLNSNIDSRLILSLPNQLLIFISQLFRKYRYILLLFGTVNYANDFKKSAT